MLKEQVEALLSAAVAKMHTAGVDLDLFTMRTTAGEITAYYRVLELLGADMQEYKDRYRKLV
jgi:hypothetical protein